MLCLLLQAHKYTIHSRFGHLRASSVEARLQLACLYAATSSLLPEPNTNMTGTQIAMQLISQSWVNTPLSDVALQHLHAAAEFAGHLAPAVRLRVSELEGSSKLLQHLHAAAGNPGAAPPPAAADEAGPETCQASADALSEYKLQVLGVLPGGWTLNPRLRLTPEEEARLLGTSSLAKAATVLPAWRRIAGQYNAVDAAVPQCPVPAGHVVDCEAQLQALVLEEATAAAAAAGDAGGGSKMSGLFGRWRQHATNSSSSSSSSSLLAYPLRAGVGRDSTPLEEMQHADLRSSWEAHHSMHTPTRVHASAAVVISSMQVGWLQRGVVAYAHASAALLSVALHNSC
jgi:hypothetical protein